MGSRSYKRYFYLNNMTGATQWQYPDEVTPPQPSDNQSAATTSGEVLNGSCTSATSVHHNINIVNQSASSTTVLNEAPPPPPDSSSVVS